MCPARIRGLWGDTSAKCQDSPVLAGLSPPHMLLLLRAKGGDSLMGAMGELLPPAG